MAMTVMLLSCRTLHSADAWCAYVTDTSAFSIPLSSVTCVLPGVHENSASCLYACASCYCLLCLFHGLTVFGYLYCFRVRLVLLVTVCCVCLMVSLFSAICTAFV